MCQYESWRVIRRIVTPPAFPLIVWPFPTNGSKHIAPEDEGPKTFHGASGEAVIEPGFAALFSLHLTKSPRWEKPLISGPRKPSGCSKLCAAPAPKPSSETLKPETFTLVIN